MEYDITVTVLRHQLATYFNLLIYTNLLIEESIKHTSHVNCSKNKKFSPQFKNFEKILNLIDFFS